nr:MAG TPA: hypothetical protein [Caudoviricetes sp.]
MRIVIRKQLEFCNTITRVKVNLLTRYTRVDIWRFRSP